MKKTILPFITFLYAVTSTAQLIEYNYICPVPDSRYINPEQVIILKTGYGFDPLSIHHAFAKLYGTESGFIGGVMSLSADLKTLFVHPNKRFALGEEVHAFISPGLKTIDGKNIASTSFDFMIREQAILPLLNSLIPEEEEISALFKPELTRESTYAGRDNNLPPDYPAPTNVLTTNGVAPGYTFMTPNVRMTPQYGNYLTIVDNYGIPVYYQKKDYTLFDLKLLPDGMLTFAKGANQNAALKRYYIMDDKYTVVDSVLAGNGYYIDNHDMQLLDNGHFLIIIYDPQIVNMSVIVSGGDPEAIVTGLVIQEVDNNQNVYFQWRSWDHFEITDATDDIDLTAHQIDYVHANALDIDDDGHILVSCRNMDEITKINFNTGNIIWRFGPNADNNQFVVQNDPVGFSHQHDIRKLENGNYTLFDNGNLNTPQLSRSVEYSLNEQTMIADLVWSYQHTPSIYASSTGSSRRLPNNNTLVGWGGSSPCALTEVTTAGSKAFELFLPNNVAGYRVLKYNFNTTLFTSQDQIGFGNCVDISEPKEYFLQITNNYSQSIQINSIHTHQSEHFYVEDLPLTILPGNTAQLHVFFQPSEVGEYEDILTLNYDNFGNTRRVARQVKLTGLMEPDLPSLQFDPENGVVEVDPYTEITATFSEPVRKVFGQEITDEDVPNLFYLKKSNLFGNNVSFHGTVSDDKTVITIIPDEPLEGDQQYYCQLIPNKLADYQNNVIDYSDYCFFVTGDLVGQLENSMSDRIIVYPNPAKENIVVESHLENITKIELITVDGRLVSSSSHDSRLVRIDLSKLPAGILLLKITTWDNLIYSRRIVTLNR